MLRYGLSTPDASLATDDCRLPTTSAPLTNGEGGASF